jgi:hypothetical protein
MSLIGTVANYGGRQPDNFQGIKQFVVGSDSLAIWVYKKLPSGLKVQTPADKVRPVYISSDLYVNGSLYNTSDIRLKENIEKISTLKTNSLLDLKPVEYHFKSDAHQQLHYGFIAQEIESVYPELVKKSEIGYKRVNYIELIPLLVSKMQLMQNEINELKEQIRVNSDV